MRTVSLDQKETIKNYLEGLSGKATPDGKFKEDVWKAVIEKFTKEFGKLSQIDQETFNVKVLDSGQVVSNTPKISKTLSERDTTKISTIEKKVIELEKQIESLNPKINKSSLSYSEFDDLSKKIIKIRKDFEILKASETYKDKMVFNVRTDTDVQNLIKELNEFAYSSALGAAAMQKGYLFEYLIGTIPAVLGKKADEISYEEIQAAIEKSSIGKTGVSKVTIDTSKFFKGVKWAEILNNYTPIGENRVIYESQHASQDKVDISFSLNEQDIYQISAKNINPYSGKDIHLVSGASLLAMIQDQNENFINHFLNIMVSHPKDQPQSIALRNGTATRLMDTTLTLLAFSGYKGATKADVFIINDNTSGTVHIYSIRELMNKILMDGQDVTSAVTIKAGEGNPYDLTQKRAKSGYPERITNILAQVHAKKISVSIKPSFFTGLVK